MRTLLGQYVAAKATRPTLHRMLIAFVGLAVTLFAASAVGQAYDYEVQEQRDEFTGEYTCGHRADNSFSDDSGVQLNWAPDSGLGYVVFIYRDWSDDPDTWVWNSIDTTPLPNDTVYIRFPDGEVVTLAPDFVEVNDGIQQTDVAAFADAYDLATRIMSSPGDIRVRFDGAHGQRDFTIRHEVVGVLAGGFGQICMR